MAANPHRSDPHETPRRAGHDERPLLLFFTNRQLGRRPAHVEPRRLGQRDREGAPARDRGRRRREPPLREGARGRRRCRRCSLVHERNVLGRHEGRATGPGHRGSHPPACPHATARTDAPRRRAARRRIRRARDAAGATRWPARVVGAARGRRARRARTTSRRPRRRSPTRSSSRSRRSSSSCSACSRSSRARPTCSG